MRTNELLIVSTYTRKSRTSFFLACITTLLRVYVQSAYLNIQRQQGIKVKNAFRYTRTVTLKFETRL